MKLPKVFANIIDKDINNNEDYFHGHVEGKYLKNNDDLKNYFDRNGYANRLYVLIKTSEGERVERLILYKNDYVVNINNEKIFLKDIISFEIKK